MLEEFSHIFSSQRLESFRQRGSDDLDMVTRCLWNTALCESLYPTLQLLEVGMRNKIHEALTFCNRTPLWFKGAFLCIQCKEDIEAAENELIKEGRDPNNPGRVVAELNFGFWTRLFNRHYQTYLWNNRTFTGRVFPNATNIQRTRHTLSVRVDNIRRFRNRVFHHQPILSSKLQDRYNDIIELFEWIDPTLVKQMPLCAGFQPYIRLNILMN
jgi:hypothetical protein